MPDNKFIPKKGLIKQEELDWSGITDWLNQQEGKVLKQDILDFLAENNIRVEEVEKGAQQGRLVWEDSKYGSTAQDPCCG